MKYNFFVDEMVCPPPPSNAKKINLNIVIMYECNLVQAMMFVGVVKGDDVSL
jgi:hypothetical protein